MVSRVNNSICLLYSQGHHGTSGLFSVFMFLLVIIGFIHIYPYILIKFDVLRSQLDIIKLVYKLLYC